MTVSSTSKRRKELQEKLTEINRHLSMHPQDFEKWADAAVIEVELYKLDAKEGKLNAQKRNRSIR